jgi:hypothetical protein
VELGDAGHRGGARGCWPSWSEWATAVGEDRASRDLARTGALERSAAVKKFAGGRGGAPAVREEAWHWAGRGPGGGSVRAMQRKGRAAARDGISRR